MISAALPPANERAMLLKNVGKSLSLQSPSIH